MRHRNDFSLKNVIKMPLRDLLRGMSAFATVTNEAMRPSGSTLPFPIPSPFLSALDAVGMASARMVDIEVDVADIAAASSALKAAGSQPVDGMMFCRVFVQAWSRLLSVSSSKHLIISEVIVAGGFERSRMKPVSTPYDHASNLILSLRKMHAAGRLPGTPFPAAPEEQPDIDVTLYATLLWLLADRERDIADENRLLEMAYAFTKAQEDQVTSSFGTRESLANSLQALAEQL